MGFFDSLFGGGKKSNPANAAQPYFNQIPGQTSGYYQPYINAGQQAIPRLQGEYDSLLSNPGAKLNQIGSEFHQSPGFKFALEQALGSVNRRNTANGMGGSPMNDQQDMELATQLGNQDYYNWLNHGTDFFEKGLSGEQGLATGGLAAGGSLADMIAQTLAQQGNLAFRGQQEDNSRNNSTLGGIGKAIGALSAFTPWGKAGGALDTAYNRFYGGNE